MASMDLNSLDIAIELLLKEPNQMNSNTFINSIQILGEEYKTDSFFQRKIENILESLISHYTETKSELHYEAILKIVDILDDKRIESKIISEIKQMIKNPSKQHMDMIRLFLSKCENPSETKKNIIFRVVRKPVKKVYRTLHIEGLQAYSGSIKNYKKYGYTKNTILTWNRLKKKDYVKHSDIDKSLIKWAHNHGYLYNRVEQYGLNESNVGDFISDLDYILLSPINNSYVKWIEDIPSLRYVFVPLKKYFPDSYYHVINRDGKVLFVPMPDCPENYHGNDANEVLRLLKEKGKLVFRPAQYASGYSIYQFRYENDTIYLSNRVLSEEEVIAILTSQKRFYVVQAYVEMVPGLKLFEEKKVSELRTIIINEKVFNPLIADTQLCLNDGSFSGVNVENGKAGNITIPKWEIVKKQLLEVVSFIPQLEYYAIYYKVTDQGISIQSINPHPALADMGVPSKELTGFLQRKLLDRRAKERKTFSAKRIKNFMWKSYKKIFCPPGYRDFMLKQYMRGIIDDFLHFKNTSIKQKLWSYKRGYYSFRIDQYGLNEDNWRDFLSDRDYNWLCPINNVYQKWIDDKMTYRHVIEPFNYVAPKYYYHIMNRDGEQYAIRMIDCPEKYPSTFEGIVDLLKDAGALAVKQSAGEHGDGFFKLSYKDGKYFINHDEVARDDVIDKLTHLSCFYNVTEFLTMHDGLRHIYPGSVNTIRVMVLNPTGCEPFIANAYMRIGTGSTKMTDNIGYGGVFAKVDLETGKYYGAERLQNHIIVPCPNHPDTNVFIEGYLPEWENVKKYLLDICRYFGQLEYLGFDVAISNEGVRILEINKYQDLHRCAFYGEEIQNFYKQKIEGKKQRLNLK